jgi:hypothetical protein
MILDFTVGFIIGGIFGMFLMIMIIGGNNGDSNDK